MNTGGTETTQPGNRGLADIRHMDQQQFEACYKNIVGFEEAHLCWSNHPVWCGSQEHGVRVLEAYVNLDSVQFSYTINRSQEKRQLDLNADFIDRIKYLFFCFYNSDKNAEYTQNSTLDIAFKDVADLDWQTPQIIILYLTFNIDGEEKIFPIMENSNDWHQESQSSFQDQTYEYIQHCSDRYTAFLANYMQHFDEDGKAMY